MQHDRFGQGSLTPSRRPIPGIPQSHRTVCKHRISMGAQTAFQQRRLDESSLLFYDQFDNYSHGAFGPTDEAIVQGTQCFLTLGWNLLESSVE